jgi:hypothetical protein
MLFKSLLYVGEGIPQKGRIGYNIFSVLDHSLLYHINGRDTLALHRW